MSLAVGHHLFLRHILARFQDDEGLDRLPPVGVRDADGAGLENLVVLEEDLVAALTSGKVRAYGTDVWYNDPPAPECPLLTAPNVFMAPHLGASSKENLGRIGDEVVAILTDFKA